MSIPVASGFGCLETDRGFPDTVIDVTCAFRIPADIKPLDSLLFRTQAVGEIHVEFDEKVVLRFGRLKIDSEGLLKESFCLPSSASIEDSLKVYCDPYQIKGSRLMPVMSDWIA
ncbi:hypothetical protein L596_002135 [Steinernema carpocapsae]|uniref:Uncharacterized protein n=1 Tax=Steinernema carpocapsae TaxID=34508 RepID=A0A4U8UNL2_STECR|nr:hypothetical protein L596_002135 [Steinernema carpocapsae]